MTETTDISGESHKIAFWGSNPNILLDGTSITELFPLSDMQYNQKLNAISRLVIVMTLLIYFIVPSIRVLIICIITLGAIYLLHHSYGQPKKQVRFSDQEAFESSKPVQDYLKTTQDNLFAGPTSNNPLQNVLMTDYDNASNKKPAPPSYLPSSEQTIMEQTKQMIDEANPEQPRISEKLFKSVEDSLSFEQSLRPFYSNPSTTIPNDQGAFADFCYGSMISCKEGNPFACARNLSRYTN